MSLSEIPELLDAGYNHFGDPDYYSYKGVGYLIVPIENGPYPAIAFFRSVDLSFAAYAYIYDQEGHAPWCAINHADGMILSSAFDDTSFKKYGMDWDQIASAHYGLITLGLPERTFFRDSRGVGITLRNIQGGELTDSDRLFYVISGYMDSRIPCDGISVFNVSTGNMVSHSTNGGDPFNFEFHPGWSKYEEPEGLTIWDLDAKPPGTTGGITGQLHVLLLDNPAPSDFFLKHYTNIISVDSAYLGSGNGRPESPLPVIYSENTMINDLSWATTQFGWDGARMKIKTGYYPESPPAPGTLIYHNQVQLIPKGGPVRIWGRTTLHPGAFVISARTGNLKFQDEGEL